VDSLSIVAVNPVHFEEQIVTNIFRVSSLISESGMAVEGVHQALTTTLNPGPLAALEMKFHHGDTEFTEVDISCMGFLSVFSVADILAGFRREQSNGKLKTGTVFARRLIL
jgi:hypothetical protein